jgi:NitT/TauT family transport system ATP-binding protein
MTHSYSVSFNNITFTYCSKSNGNTDNFYLYENFSLDIAPYSVTAILGGSGSGKSTLGRMTAGMLKPTQGEVILSSELTNLCDTVYIDQNPMNSIFPWQTVQRNLTYPLQKLKKTPLEIQERVNYLTHVFHLENLLTSYPLQLSGGELQRLALARLLSWRPKLVILDESFSALDQNLREQITDSLQEIIKHDKMTVILITHNIPEALKLANRCIVLGKRPVSIIYDIDVNNPLAKESAQNKLLEAIKYGFL